VVREGGVEPPRDFAHWILSPARLPVPPLSRVRDCRGGEPPCLAWHLVSTSTSIPDGGTPGKKPRLTRGVRAGGDAAAAPSRADRSLRRRVEPDRHPSVLVPPLACLVVRDGADVAQADVVDPTARSARRRTGSRDRGAGPWSRSGRSDRTRDRRAGGSRPANRSRTTASPGSRDGQPPRRRSPGRTSGTGGPGRSTVSRRPRRSTPVARTSRAQRLRFRPRNPRRLPLRLNGRPPPGRSPPGPERAGGIGRGPSCRGGRSSAALTVSRRPATSRSWKRRIASAASASVANWTKANPRGRLVSRSAGR
jgi:hypothetical protein